MAGVWIVIAVVVVLVLFILPAAIKVITGFNSLSLILIACSR
jgi:hypothetical protein